MRKEILGIIIVFCFVLAGSRLEAQTYFPPTTGSWDTLSASGLGWCTSELAPLYNFLDTTNTRGFIVLKQGKIVIEKYFNNHGPDSLWYWASAGKSLVAYLYGILLQNGAISLNDQTSRYLGKGWTSAPRSKEDLITIRHHLSMSTGLDDKEFNCLADTCLKYVSDAGTRWSYHNGPYRLLQDILENATGYTKNRFTRDSIGRRIGMGGFWLGYVRYGTARDLARFGLLALNNGIWSTDTILRNNSYIQAMSSSSQGINPSYGYLWWLNGKDTLMIPGSQFRIPTDLIPDAPTDLYAALGANDQKIHVVPSMDLVVVRIGNAPDTSATATSGYDNEIWKRLNKLMCVGSALRDNKFDEVKIYPNPGGRQRSIDLGNVSGNRQMELKLLDMQGRAVWKETVLPGDRSMSLDFANIQSGIYMLSVINREDGKRTFSRLIFH